MENFKKGDKVKSKHSERTTIVFAVPGDEVYDSHDYKVADRGMLLEMKGAGGIPFWAWQEDWEKVGEWD